MEFVLTSGSPEETTQLGVSLAALLEPGDVIVLSGDLGAGKTCFTQGLAEGLGCVAHVTSPTFVLLHQLEGRLTLYHFDLYRIESAREFADLGFDDILYGDGVSVIEWGDKFPGELPDVGLELVFHFEGDTSRRIQARASGERWERVADEWSGRRGSQTERGSSC